MKSKIDDILKLGINAHKAGDLRKAEELYRSILGTQPRHADANHNLGVLEVNLGRINSAIIHFQEALVSNPAIEQFWASYIDALIKIKQPEKARIFLKEARTRGIDSLNINKLEVQLKGQENASLWSDNIGNPSIKQLDDLIALYSRDKQKEALTLGKTLLKKFPSNAIIPNVLGAIYFKLGKYEKAIFNYNKAIDLKTDYTEAIANRGVALKNLGKYQEAITSYETAIKLKPDYAEAYNNLGNIVNASENHQQAIKYYKKAIQIKPEYAEAHNNLGNALNALGEFEDAINSYYMAIKFRPHYVESFINLGNVFNTIKRYEDAINSYDKAFEIRSDFAEAHNNKGNALFNLGRYQQSCSSYKRAIDLQTYFAEAYNNLGSALNELGCFEESLIVYEKAIMLKPNFCEALNNKGNLLNYFEKYEDALVSYKRATNIRLDFSELHYNIGAVFYSLGMYQVAINSFKGAICLQPIFSKSYNNLGNTLNRLGLSARAITCYNMGIKCQPDFFEAYSNLGKALNDRGQHNKAILSLNKALSINSRHAETYNNLGNALNDIGKYKEAITCYDKAIDLKPDYASAYNNKNLALNYSPYFSNTFIFQQHLRFGKHFGERKIRPPWNTASDKITNRRLRVGYVSPDFNTHSVAYFFEPLLEHHDSKTVETFCYYNDIKIDDTTRRLIEYSEHWRSVVNISDSSVVDLIKEDKIDILVDLTGHTAKNRLLVFANKPAPIQISWLGYPNTTGLKTIDYRFTDSIADPIGEADKLYSERLIRLNNGFLCYKGNKNICYHRCPPNQERGHITFGSFNNLSKLTPQVVKIWSKILIAIPNSHLILKAQQLTYNKQRYFDLFQQQGVFKERLRLYGHLPNANDHLGLYNSIDICLDPFPFNGATTTCEALWMGVPVVTLAGDNHAGRVGASILTNLGMTDLIAQNIPDYIDTAIKIARHENYLKDLKQQLRDKMLNSTLCDGDAFAKKVEQVYVKILSGDSNF